MTVQPIPPIEPFLARAANLGDQAHDHLRELILSRQIPGGTEVSEARLADYLKVSRTPMREALVRLVGEGLLERAADRAYRVRSVSAREFFESMQLREVLECLAIEKAIPVLKDEDLARLRHGLLALGDSGEDDMQHWQFDNQFHSFFARSAGHAMLADTITRMRVIARLFRISTSFHRKGEIDSEHLAILVAAERRDAEAAKAAMLTHLRNLQEDARRAIADEANPGGYFR